MCGAIPPINAWIVSFVTYLKVAPFQLQPNSYAILVCLFVIFQRKYGRPLLTGRFDTYIT